MARNRSRQQRRARSRAPLRRKRRGSTAFLVVLLALVVGGGALITVSRTSRPPLTRGAIAGEHWHASLDIYICGREVTSFPSIEGELHSHGDGFLHIHPQTPAASGDNANLGTFFSLYGTSLTEDDEGRRELRFPDGDTYRDGDRCDDDGDRYEFEITNKGEPIEGDPSAFLPHDGDAIVIRFGPEETEGVLPNPYAAVHGLPDPGVAGATPVPEGEADPIEPPDDPAEDGEAEPSPAEPSPAD